MLPVNKGLFSVALGDGSLGMLPIQPTVFTSANVRICSKLCLALAGNPMYERITDKEAGALLAELLAVRLGDQNQSVHL